MRRIIYIIVFITLTAQPSFSIYHKEAGDTCKVLFMGNSYTLYNHLPSLFKGLSRTANKTVLTDDHLVEGTGVSDWSASNDVEELIKSEAWDYAVIQGSVTVAYPEYYSSARVFESLEVLKDKIISNFDSTKIIYIMPWAFEDGMTWMGWDDDYSDMQEKIYINTLKYCNELNIVIAPVGWAWYSVLEEKQYPLHYLHMEDYNHPSPRGSYLMACVLYSVIFLESPAGIPFFSLLPEEEARYFQQVAGDVVFKNPTNWNLPDVKVGIGSMNEDNIILGQNYPNPARGLTRIDYNTSISGFVELSVFNSNGVKCYELVNEYARAGDYSVIFDCCCLTAGLYYYVLRSGNEIVTRRMVIVD